MGNSPPKPERNSGKKNREIRIFKDTAGMAEFIAGFIVKKIGKLSGEEQLNIALSGGKTPVTIFEHINLHLKERIDWEKLGIFQIDERCVPPGDPESNFRMIHDSLLNKLGFPEENLFRMRGENDPESEAERYSGVLTGHLPFRSGWPVLDLILLGLGTDGHTASLFPYDNAILQSERCVEVSSHPHSGQKRITLTLPVINHARNQIFVVTGHEKAQMVAEIIHNIPSDRYPASLVTPEKGHQFWMLDDDAARMVQTHGY